MSEPDPTKPVVDLQQIEAEEQREKIRNRVILVLITLVGFAVAAWVGAVVDDAQEDTGRAQAKTEQVEVEKFNLAQQIAAACSDPDSGLDEAAEARLCRDAQQIVREGPQGAQGIPGVQGPAGEQGATGAQGPQGVQGIPGTDGVNGLPGKDGAVGPPGEPGQDGADGEQGPPGPAGADGQDGSMGPAGPPGQDGEPPVSWVVYGTNGTVTERCQRVDDFNPAEPRYTCTRENALP